MEWPCLWPGENSRSFPRGWHLFLFVGHGGQEGKSREKKERVVKKLWLFLRGGFPAAPSGFLCYLSLRDVLATRRTGCWCLPVESFPRRSESWGDSLQKAACQPPLFFLSQQRYGNRGELKACQSSSPLIPPVQINHPRFALSFPRLLSLLGLASISFLAFSLSSYLLATSGGSRAAWVICQARGVIFARA